MLSKYYQERMILVLCIARVHNVCTFYVRGVKKGKVRACNINVCALCVLGIANTRRILCGYVGNMC